MYFFRFKQHEELGQLLQVDFIWVNRDYTSLEWFLLLLRDLERFTIFKVSFHLYMIYALDLCSAIFLTSNYLLLLLPLLTTMTLYHLLWP